jgi:hypothetical protein
LRIVEPAVIAAAQSVFLDATPFERGAAMCAMRLQRADPAFLVAKDDDFLAEQLDLPGEVADLVRRADRLPIAAQQLAHRAARLDAGELIVRRGGLPSVG